MSNKLEILKKDLQKQLEVLKGSEESRASEIYFDEGRVYQIKDTLSFIEKLNK